MPRKLFVVINNQTFTQHSAASAAQACGKEYLINRVITLTALYIYIYLVTTEFSFVIKSEPFTWLACIAGDGVRVVRHMI